MSRRAILARSLSNLPMRRALLTWGLVSVLEYAAYFIVIFMAFEAGGAGLAGIAAAAQLGPSILVPAIIRIIDRLHVAPMRVALGWLFLGLSAGAVAAVGPAWLVIVVGALRGFAYALARPIHLAVVPVHAEHTADATAGMVVTGWFDSIGAMVGPAVAGLVLAGLSPEVGMAGLAAVSLAGFWLSPTTGEAVGSGAEQVRRSVFRVPGAKEMLTYKTFSSALSGSTDVVVVLVAIELLGLGEDGAGYLASLFGAGEFIGGLLLVSLLGRTRLSGPLGSAAFGRGVFVSLLGVVPQAFPALVVSGAFRPMHRVVQRLFLQRITPPDRYMRMFGVTGAFDSGGRALGAALVPVLVAVFGVEAAIVIAGALLPASFVALRRVFRGIDERAVIPKPIIAAIAASPAFDGLAPDAIEYLARTGTIVELPPGEQLIARGDEDADAAWLILSGALDVSIDGDQIARLRRPDVVGEIALIHEEPRHADVFAHTPSELLRIDHESFLDIVLGGASGGDHLRVLAARRVEQNRRGNGAQ